MKISLLLLPLLSLLAVKTAKPETFKKLEVKTTSNINTSPPNFKSIEITSLHTTNMGITYSLTGELPRKVIDVDKGKIDTFELDNGQSMLSPHNLINYSSWARLKDDGKTVNFNIETNQTPDPGVAMIKSITGEIICWSSQSEKTIDLGFSIISPQEKGKHYSSEIIKIENVDQDKGKQLITLKHSINRREFKKIQFFDNQGIVINADRQSTSWSRSGLHKITYLCDNNLTHNSQIKAVIHTGIRRWVISYSLQNIPLIPTKKKKAGLYPAVKIPLKGGSLPPGVRHFSSALPSKGVQIDPERQEFFPKKKNALPQGVTPIPSN